MIVGDRISELLPRGTWRLKKGNIAKLDDRIKGMDRTVFGRWRIRVLSCYLGGDVVDVGAAHADEPPEAFHLGGDVRGVHPDLHHLRSSLSSPLPSDKLSGIVVFFSYGISSGFRLE